MKLQLKVGGKVKYSRGEQACFKALSSTARSSTAIMSKVYPKSVPYNGRKIMIGMLTSLRRKLITNREPFKLMSTERRGPYPMEFWLEQK